VVTWWKRSSFLLAYSSWDYILVYSQPTVLAQFPRLQPTICVKWKCSLFSKFRASTRQNRYAFSFCLPTLTKSRWKNSKWYRRCFNRKFSSELWFT
jgi:hypothetical protein